MPDVPIRKVDFLFYGGTGNNGLLNAFSDLCSEKSFGDVSFTAHNGKNVKYRSLLEVRDCPPVAKLTVQASESCASRAAAIARLGLRCGGRNRCAGEATLVTGSEPVSGSKLRTIGKGRSRSRRGAPGS